MEIALQNTVLYEDVLVSLDALPIVGEVSERRFDRRVVRQRHIFAGDLLTDPALKHGGAREDSIRLARVTERLVRQ